jgi:hypothetical protein
MSLKAQWYTSMGIVGRNANKFVISGCTFGGAHSSGNTTPEEEEGPFGKEWVHWLYHLSIHPKGTA